MRKHGTQVPRPRAGSTSTGSDLAAPGVASAAPGASLPPAVEPQPTSDDYGCDEFDPFPDRLARVEDAFSGSDSLDDFRGSPILLDVLAELPPSHELRLGLRCQVFREAPDGDLELQPRSWTQQVPTQELVSKLVTAGELAPGAYVVRLRIKHRTAPDIRFRIAEPHPAHSAAGAGALDFEGVAKLLRALRSDAPALPAPVGADVLQGVQEALTALDARLGTLEAQVGELVGAGSAAAAGGGGFLEGIVGKLVEAWMARQAGAPAEAVVSPAGVAARAPGVADVARRGS